jgi:hypothetical protein
MWKIARSKAHAALYCHCVGWACAVERGSGGAGALRAEQSGGSKVRPSAPAAGDANRGVNAHGRSGGGDGRVAAAAVAELVQERAKGLARQAEFGSGVRQGLGDGGGKAGGR